MKTIAIKGQRPITVIDIIESKGGNVIIRQSNNLTIESFEWFCKRNCDCASLILSITLFINENTTGRIPPTTK